MKPFITDAFKNGLFILEYQCEGIHKEEIGNLLKGAGITAFAMPQGHSFASAWQFRLFFDNRYLIDFSSACTEVGGWQEVGSLNIRASLGDFPDEDKNVKPLVKTNVDGFRVDSIDSLVYEDADVYAECGIVFRDLSGKEITIVAGQSPGSVSVLAPFSAGEFKPEFAIEAYSRLPI